MIFEIEDIPEGGLNLDLLAAKEQLQLLASPVLAITLWTVYILIMAVWEHGHFRKVRLFQVERALDN